MRFAGVTHPGLIGTAPSPELLATWNERETGLIQENPTSVPPVAFAPLATGAYVGQDLDSKVREKIYREGARTVPGREHGGNCDVCLFLFFRLAIMKLIPRLVDQEPFKASIAGPSRDTLDFVNLNFNLEDLVATFQCSSKAQIYLSGTYTSLKAM